MSKAANEHKGQPMRNCVNCGAEIGNINNLCNNCFEQEQQDRGEHTILKERATKIGEELGHIIYEEMLKVLEKTKKEVCTIEAGLCSFCRIRESEHLFGAMKMPVCSWCIKIHALNMKPKNGE